MIRPANMEHAQTATMVICAATLTIVLALFALAVRRERGYAQSITCPEGCEVYTDTHHARSRATCWCDTRGD